MGAGVELMAVSVIAVTAGLLVFRSKLNCIFSPAFSNAVIGGITVRGKDGGQTNHVLLLGLKQATNKYSWENGSFFDKHMHDNYEKHIHTCPLLSLPTDLSLNSHRKMDCE